MTLTVHSSNSGAARRRLIRVWMVSPNILEIPADLAAAFEQNKKAKAKFEQLSYSQKRIHTLSVEIQKKQKLELNVF